MNTPLILCVGSATADHIFKIGGFPLNPVKVRADDYGFSGGGMAANAAVAIVRLGGRAEFCGRLGTDPAGRDLIEDFRRHGVGTDAIVVLEGTRTSTSVVLVDEKGERCVCNYRGQFGANSGVFNTSVVQASLVSASVVLADVRWLDGAASILREARRRGIASVLDADVAPREDLEMLTALSDHVIFSASGLSAFAPDLTQESALDKALTYGCAMAAVTRGEDGVLWRAANSPHRASTPAFRVAAVETLAAGDVFHGAYALALAEGQGIEAALRFSSATAALKCTRVGGRAGMPTRAEVDLFLRNQLS